MRFSSLVTGILLAWLGGSGGPAEPPREARMAGPSSAPDITAERRPQGHLRRGAGFTVWEETREEADAWAEELASCPRVSRAEPS